MVFPLIYIFSLCNLNSFLHHYLIIHLGVMPVSKIYMRYELINHLHLVSLQISNADFALVQAVHDNANLRSKIVQSPDKLLV